LKRKKRRPLMKRRRAWGGKKKRTMPWRDSGGPSTRGAPSENKTPPGFQKTGERHRPHPAKSNAKYRDQQRKQDEDRPEEGGKGLSVESYRNRDSFHPGSTCNQKKGGVLLGQKRKTMVQKGDRQKKKLALVQEGKAVCPRPRDNNRCKSKKQKKESSTKEGACSDGGGGGGGGVGV